MFTRKHTRILTYDQALNRAAQLCSKGEQCPSEIYAKVQEWGLSSEDAARLVQYLAAEKYLDETRYVHAFINDKYSYQHWGRMKIAYTLRMKGIDESLIADNMDEIIDPADYLSTCLTLIKTKVKGMEIPLSQTDRAKVFRFAAQRGFETSVITKALSLLGSAAED